MVLICLDFFWSFLELLINTKNYTLIIDPLNVLGIGILYSKIFFCKSLENRLFYNIKQNCGYLESEIQTAVLEQKNF